MTEPAYALQCKAVALTVFATRPVMAKIDGADWAITQIDLVDAPHSATPPGSVIEQLADGLLVQTGSGPARLFATKT